MLLLLGLTGCGNTPGASILDAASPPPDLAAPMDKARTCAGAGDGGTCVTTVSGSLVDEKGAPLADMVVSYCAEICFFGKTVADGSFVVDVYSYLPVERYALLVHARPDHASLYTVPPPLDGDHITFTRPVVTPTLPADGPLLAVDGSAQTASSNDITVAIDKGTNLFFDPEDIQAGDKGHKLRALPITRLSDYLFIDPQHPPTQLYALSPFELVSFKPMRITVANRSGFAAGTAVDFLAMRGLISDGAPAGRLNPVATGHVSSDGARIEMDPGIGILSLTWLGVRLHQQ